MLVIEVGFPAGRCYAGCGDAPDTPEWPPHPSRLYSALVASACTGREAPDLRARAALEWLEEQPPPVIQAPPADVTPAPTGYVPPGDVNRQAGKVEHPVHRLRKDRFFPAAFIHEEPVVRYGWRESPPGDVLDALDTLSAGMTHVGTSHSMVVARTTEADVEYPTHLPGTPGDDFLRCPVPGRLNELMELHSRAKPYVRRPLSGYEPLVGYSVVDGRLRHLRSPYGAFHVLRFRGLGHGMESAQLLGRGLRRAVMSRLSDPIPEAVHGHGEAPHVAWLPLSDVGHRHAGGRIMGMAVAVPRSMQESEQQALLAALGAVAESGVHLDDGRDYRLEPLPLDRPAPRTLDERTWSGASRHWATISPVVPDRLPRRERERYVRASIADSLVRVGYPEPESVEVGRYSWVDGVPAAHRFPSRLPRYHAAICFPQEVRGPVIAGRLRHFGVGFFRPV